MKGLNVSDAETDGAEDGSDGSGDNDSNDDDDNWDDVTDSDDGMSPDVEDALLRQVLGGGLEPWDYVQAGEATIVTITCMLWAWAALSQLGFLL